MDTVKNNFDEILDIIKKICELSEKVTNIIKEYNAKDDNDDIGNRDDIAFDISKLYDERNLSINKLSAKFASNEIDTDLLKNNSQWNDYLHSIVLFEQENIAFLDMKTKEKKNKLNELSNNKSLMIYNKKVNLSYENKFL